jgi:hypothetical protein
METKKDRSLVRPRKRSTDRRDTCPPPKPACDSRSVPSFSPSALPGCIGFGETIVRGNHIMLQRLEREPPVRLIENTNAEMNGRNLQYSIFR